MQGIRVMDQTDGHELGSGDITPPSGYELLDGHSLSADAGGNIDLPFDFTGFCPDGTGHVCRGWQIELFGSAGQDLGSLVSHLPATESDCETLGAVAPIGAGGLAYAIQNTQTGESQIVWTPSTRLNVAYPRPPN